MINFYFKKGLYKKLYRIATDAIMDLNTKLNIEKYNLLLKEEELQRMKKWSKL
jgi:hypothetical protein